MRSTGIHFYSLVEVEGYVNAVNVGRLFGGGISYSFNYVYNYTDPLGNIRMSYSYDPAIGNIKIMEENHYYPFGLKQTRYNSDELLWSKNATTKQVSLSKMAPTDNAAYQYKYNGKELQSELGLDFYDYGARNYDPALGRWMSIDPKAENSRRWTPYNYAYNNPIYFVDPDGMQAEGGEFIPDKDGNLIIEEGDTEEKLLKEHGLKVKKGTATKGFNFSPGQKLILNNNFSRALKKSNSEQGLTTEEILSEGLSLGESIERSNKETDGYNCTELATVGVLGMEINPENADLNGEGDILSFEKLMKNKSMFDEVSEKDAIPGKTVYQFGYNHAAVHYVTSNDGTAYVVTKNGEYAKPTIMPLREVEKLPGYGKVTNIYNYNPK